MKELLKEIEYSSCNLVTYPGSEVECIMLTDLKEILSRYEVVSKELNKPYTT